MRKRDSFFAAGCLSGVRNDPLVVLMTGRPSATSSQAAIIMTQGLFLNRQQTIQAKFRFVIAVRLEF